MEDLKALIEAQAELYAQEFSNRQILLQGQGQPTIQAPIGVEYEDRSTTPARRFRKVGANPSDWLEIKVLDLASSEEVQAGSNQNKLITPYTLEQRLSEFSQAVLNLPTARSFESASSLQLAADNPSDGEGFQVQIPLTYKASFLSLTVEGYGLGGKLTGVIGGEIGQIITVRRGEVHPLVVEHGTTIKLSANMVLEDSGQLDHLSLVKVEEEKWAEVARKKFA